MEITGKKTSVLDFFYDKVGKFRSRAINSSVLDEVRYNLIGSKQN